MNGPRIAAATGAGTHVADARRAGATAAVARLVRAELIKLATVPEVVAAAALAVVVAGGAQAVISGLGGHDWWPGGAQRFAQLGLLVLGVLAVGPETEGRTLRTALLAAPRRGRMLAAKVIAFGCVATPVALGAVTAMRAATVGMAGSRWTWHGVGGETAVLVLGGLLALGVTASARSTTSALAVLLALHVVVPPLVTALGADSALLPADAPAPTLAAWLAGVWAPAVVVTHLRDA